MQRRATLESGCSRAEIIQTAAYGIVRDLLDDGQQPCNRQLPLSLAQGNEPHARRYEICGKRLQIGGQCRLQGNAVYSTGQSNDHGVCNWPASRCLAARELIEAGVRPRQPCYLQKCRALLVTLQSSLSSAPER